MQMTEQQNKKIVAKQIYNKEYYSKDNSGDGNTINT